MKQSFVFIPLFLLSCTFSAFAFAEGDPVQPSLAAKVLADIDGVKLTLADYGKKHPGGLFQASQAFYTAERKAVEAFVDEYLLERQAQKENLTVAELLEKHVNSAASKVPSEEALRLYYEGSEVEEPYEAIHQQIIDHIREKRIAKGKAEYIKSLRSQAHISLQFGPPRLQIDLKDTPVRGPMQSAVTIVEYADYECPYCQQAQVAIDQIETEYKGKIAFAYKDTPLPSHPHEQKAAEASHCAEKQGKFWEYHDLLFKSKALDVPQLKEHARALKLDTAAFDKCLDSGEYGEKVKAGFTEAVNFGLQGTPGFFINGRFVSGVLSVEQLRAMIGEEMALSGGQAGGQAKETAQR